MAKAKFYVATLAAAVDRAARIAPVKGTAFDKAAGIVLEVDPDERSASLRATNLEVYWREEIRDVVDYGDAKIEWRLPSILFSGVISGLPLDKEVTIKDDGERQVRIFCGKKQAKLKTMPTDIYPIWGRIEADGLKPAPGFAHRVTQVAWATDRDNVPYTGVHIDGTYLNATDKYRMARVPLEVPLDEPVTVAMTTLAPLLKGLPGEINMAAEDRRLLMRVGDEIEAVSVIYEENYPDLGVVLSKRPPFTFKIKVDREALRDAIDSMLVLVKNERYPRMNFDFDDGGISIFMSVPETGDMTDVVEAEIVEGDEFSITFAPEFILKALDAGTSKHVYWSMGESNTMMTRIEDGDFLAYVMPLGKAAS